MAGLPGKDQRRRLLSRLGTRPSSSLKASSAPVETFRPGPAHCSCVTSLALGPHTSVVSRLGLVGARRAVSFRQGCVARNRSGELPKKKADSHVDVPIHLGLPSSRWHQVTAAPAFMESHPADMNLLAFQGSREVYRVGRDATHQIRSLAHLARCRLARSCFSRHLDVNFLGRSHAALPKVAASFSVAR